MPDAEPKQDSSTLEQLFEEAESAAKAPVSDKPRPCNHTRAADDGLEVKTCPTCLWPFCEMCASSLDPKYCHNCLPADKPLFEEQPLVDEDGVQHEGRVIKPSPELRLRLTTTSKVISEMTDPELEAFVKHYKELVHQAEVALDYRRVVLGSAELEQSQRATAEKRRLRAIKIQTGTKTVSVGPAKPGAAKIKDKPGTGQVKLDPAKIIAALTALRKMKQNREGDK